MSEDRVGELQRRVDALTESQQRALAEALAREGSSTQGTLPASRAGQSPQLVGFVVADGETATSEAGLREFLAARLPDYMIPSRLITLGRLPRTDAGKLDRQALAREYHAQSATAAAPRPPAAPRSALEEKLTAIWKEVLRTDQVELDDDFFEIGGDSLLSIRVMSRAAREDLRISPDQFFERPTIRHMAACIARGANATEAAPAKDERAAPAMSAVGEAPLTPIQHWFLDAVPEHRDWWNQSYLLELRHPLTVPQLQGIVGALVRHHDALRLRLTCRQGQWKQEFCAPDDLVPLRVVHLEHADAEGHEARIAEEEAREFRALRLEEGGLFRCVLLDGGEGKRWLLVLGHHILLDGVSWSVILEDLATLVALTAAGQPVRLPATITSAREWAFALAARAAETSLAPSAGHWLSMPSMDRLATAKPSQTLPHLETDGRITSTNRDAKLLTFALDADLSRQLLHNAPRRLSAPPQALLLAALLLAWRRWSGAESLRLDLEGHGRDVLGGTMDVSRTVGWFTTVFPVHLAPPATLQAGEDGEIATIVTAVQHSLDALPLHGAAHGLLRYLSPDESLRTALAAQPRPALLFNYLGVHDVTLPPASRLRVASGSHAPTRSPNSLRPYALELNSRVENSAFLVTIEYAPHLNDSTSIEAFADMLRNALAEVAHARPARFELAGLDSAGMDTVAHLLNELDDA